MIYLNKIIIILRLKTLNTKTINNYLQNSILYFLCNFKLNEISQLDNAYWFWHNKISSRIHTLCLIFFTIKCWNNNDDWWWFLLLLLFLFFLLITLLSRWIDKKLLYFLCCRNSIHHWHVNIHKNIVIILLVWVF